MTSRWPGARGIMSKKARHSGELSTTKAGGERSSWSGFGEEEGGYVVPMAQKGQPGREDCC